LMDGGGGGQADEGCWLNIFRKSFSSEGGVCARPITIAATKKTSAPRGKT